MSTSSLLSKYNKPVPRYTSYPTVPHWKDGADVDWMRLFEKDFSSCNSKKGISLYIHLPFCESLCTYCGCNKKITGNHSVEDTYIDAIHREWQFYVSRMSERPVIRELHLGGGTPTFFSAQNLRRLLVPIFEGAHIHEKHDFSFEGHPNNTTREHLQTLYDLGFRRVSFGVQDNNPEVQRIINRIQPLAHVENAIDNSRSVGYRSVNFDLVYGLPGQTVASVKQTIEETITLKPDRIAFYSYAHVPWVSKGQRLYDESDLPAADKKLEMYSAAKELFTAHGYFDIGMDHFALPSDALYTAYQSGTLHRNFMGYTTHHTDILLGLGVSSISTLPGAYMQNDKALHNYYTAINENRSAVVKGCQLTSEDKRFGGYIHDLICAGSTVIAHIDRCTFEQSVLPELCELEQDRLVHCQGDSVIVTEAGRTFIRNICSAFDLHQKRQGSGARLFSNAV